QPGIQTGDIQPDRPPFVTLRLDPCGLKEPSERDIESYSLLRVPRQQVDEADEVLHEDRIPAAARRPERTASRYPFYDVLAPQVVVRGLDPGVSVDHQSSSSSGTKSASSSLGGVVARSASWSSSSSAQYSPGSSASAWGKTTPSPTSGPSACILVLVVDLAAGCESPTIA